MTGEDFIIRCWNCQAVRQFIVDQAKRHAKHDRALQEDYIQEAWLAISTVPHCYGAEGCKYLAERVIHSAHWQEYKARLIEKNPGFIGNVDNHDGWIENGGGDVARTILRRLAPSELSEGIINQLVEFLIPALEKLGWRRL